MPKGADRTLITVTVTPAQRAAIQQLQGDATLAAYVRRLIREDAERQGVPWPDDLNPPGVRVK